MQNKKYKFIKNHEEEIIKLRKNIDNTDFIKRKIANDILTQQDVDDCKILMEYHSLDKPKNINSLNSVVRMLNLKNDFEKIKITEKEIEEKYLNNLNVFNKIIRDIKIENLTKILENIKNNKLKHAFDSIDNIRKEKIMQEWEIKRMKMEDRNILQLQEQKRQEKFNRYIEELDNKNHQEMYDLQNESRNNLIKRTRPGVSEIGIQSSIFDTYTSNMLMQSFTGISNDIKNLIVNMEYNDIEENKKSLQNFKNKIGAMKNPKYKDFLNDYYLQDFKKIATEEQLKDKFEEHKNYINNNELVIQSTKLLDDIEKNLWPAYSKYVADKIADNNFLAQKSLKQQKDFMQDIVDKYNKNLKEIETIKVSNDSIYYTPFKEFKKNINILNDKIKSINECEKTYITQNDLTLLQSSSSRHNNSYEDLYQDNIAFIKNQDEKDIIENVKSSIQQVDNNNNLFNYIEISNRLKLLKDNIENIKNGFAIEIKKEMQKEIDELELYVKKFNVSEKFRASKEIFEMCKNKGKEDNFIYNLLNNKNTTIENIDFNKELSDYIAKNKDLSNKKDLSKLATFYENNLNYIFEIIANAKEEETKNTCIDLIKSFDSVIQGMNNDKNKKNKLDGNFLIKITQDIVHRKNKTDADISKLIRYRLQTEPGKNGFLAFVEKSATEKMKKNILKHFNKKF